MKLAIAHLENALETARTNEPIHRAQGDRRQSKLCKQVAWDCLEAIQILKLELANRQQAAKAAKKGPQS